MFANTVSGNYSVTVTITAGLAVGTFTGFTNTPLAADHLLVTGFPTSETAAQAHNFTVEAVDVFGNIDTTYNHVVAVSTSDPLTILPILSAALVNGVGIFSATFRSSGEKTITATDTTNPAFTASEFGIDISPVVDVQGEVFTQLVNQTFTTVVATFTPLFNAGVLAFTAQIDWKDGPAPDFTDDTPGTVTENSDGSFDVTGTHTFATVTTFLVQVTVFDLTNNTVEKTAPHRGHRAQHRRERANSVVRLRPQRRQRHAHRHHRPGRRRAGPDARRRHGRNAVRGRDYADNPTPAASTGQVFFDARATAVTVTDVLEVSFGYGNLNPDRVSLEVFDPDPKVNQFVPVVGSTVSAHSLVNDRVLHVISVIFDNTSFPTATALNGTVFTIAVLGSPHPGRSEPERSVAQSSSAAAASTADSTGPTLSLAAELHLVADDAQPGENRVRRGTADDTAGTLPGQRRRVRRRAIHPGRLRAQRPPGPTTYLPSAQPSSS